MIFFAFSSLDSYDYAMKKTLGIFDQENEARKDVEFIRRKLPEVKPGQIWRYFVGVNIGQEISKGHPYMRPCIVLKTLKGSTLVHVVPLSSKKGMFCKEYYSPVYKFYRYKLKQSRILLHQCHTIDKKRLLKLQSKQLIPKGFLKYIVLNKI